MLADIFSSITYHDQWLYLGWHEISSRYRRTHLGPIWIVLVNLVTIFCFSVISASLFKQSLREILPYVAAGLFTWSYIAAILSDSCVLFTTQAYLMHNMQTNPISLCLRLFIRNTIGFLHSLPVLMIVILIYAPHCSWKMLLVFPAFPFFALTSISISIIFGFMAARFRDITPLVQSFITVFPFITPILWRAEMLGNRSYLATINPVTHYIALIRDPLLGNPIQLNTYLISTATTLGLLSFAAFLYKKFRNRLVYWV